MTNPPPPDVRRRFVAGAKCPHCGALDRIVMYRREGIQHRECVSCDFREEMAFEPAFRELETRVNRLPEEREQAVSVVRLVDPAGPQGD